MYHYLRQHPEVFMSDPKEPNFLYQGLGEKKACSPVAKGERIATRCYDKYCRYFEKAAGMKAVGEASTTTLFYFEQAIAAIHHYLGDPAILIILRNPAERAYSNYNYLLVDMREELSFQEALRAEETRTRLGYGLMWRYRAAGLYADPVRAYQQNFSRVKVILHEDLKRNPDLTTAQIYRFLGVSPAFVPDVSQTHNRSAVPVIAGFNALFARPGRFHKSLRRAGSRILGENRWIRLREGLRALNLRQPPLPDPFVMRELRDYFRPDILNLQELIGRDLSSWLGEAAQQEYFLKDARSLEKPEGETNNQQEKHYGAALRNRSKQRHF